MDHEVVIRVLDYLASEEVLCLADTCAGVRDCVRVALASRRHHRIVGDFPTLGRLVRAFSMLAPQMTTSLTISNVGVRFIDGEQERYGCSDRELDAADARRFVRFLPLGILTSFTKLIELRVEGESFITSLDERDAEHDDEESERDGSPAIKLGLGLANLHEIADSCPNLEILWTYHAQRSAHNGRTVDIWGPDATPHVLRKMREKLPRLRVLGFISSPNSRILGELRRMGLGEFGGSMTNFPEVRETYSQSTVEPLRGWTTLEHVFWSLPSPTLPTSSGRNAFYHYLEQGRRVAGEGIGDFGGVGPADDHSFGELNDVMLVLRSHAAREEFPPLTIAVRNRGRKRIAMESLATWMDGPDNWWWEESVIQFVQRRVQTVNSRCDFFQVPATVRGVLDFPLERLTEVVRRASEQSHHRVVSATTMTTTTTTTKTHTERLEEPWIGVHFTPVPVAAPLAEPESENASTWVLRVVNNRNDDHEAESGGEEEMEVVLDYFVVGGFGGDGEPLAASQGSQVD